MSKLVETYNNLKKENSGTIFLFRQGIFLIALDEDAKFLSEKFGLKLTNLNSTTVKCGFPSANSEKYLAKFKNENLDVKVLEKNILYNPTEYSSNQNIEKILDSIKNVDVDNLSVFEAYTFIEKIKQDVENL